MKTKILLLASLFYLVFLIFPVEGQGVYEWGPALPVTDSLTINSNPSCFWLSSNEDLAVLYEKQDCDTCNADIWFRSLTTMNPELPILTGTEMHSNPVFVSANTNNYKGFILYLSNITGDTNIFSAKVENDFSISETTQLTFTPQAEHQMTLSIEGYIQHLGWIEDSCIWTALPQIENGQISLYEITKLDSIGNTAVVFGRKNAYLQRKVGDSLHIYGRNYKYDQNTASWYWDDIYPIKTTGNNTDLSVDNSQFSMGEELIWVTNNRVHGFLYDDYSGGYEFLFNTYNLPNIQHPSYIMWDIVVKDEWMPHVLTYTTGGGNNSEVYGSFSQYGTDPDTTNLTNDQAQDSHPKLFLGEHSGTNGFWIYNVWQSHRNGYIALYYSKFLGYIEGGMNEQLTTDSTITTSPNPFSQNVQLYINSYDNNEIVIEIFSLSGKKVWRKTISGNNGNSSTITWKPGNQIPKGNYLVFISQGKLRSSTPIIYQ